MPNEPHRSRIYNKNRYLDVNDNAIQALIRWVLISVDHMLAAYYRRCRQIALRCGGQVLDSDGTQTAFNGSNA
jgi:hypothetical protein